MCRQAGRRSPGVVTLACRRSSTPTTTIHRTAPTTRSLRRRRRSTSGTGADGAASAGRTRTSRTSTTDQSNKSSRTTATSTATTSSPASQSSTSISQTPSSWMLTSRKRKNAKANASRRLPPTQKRHLPTLAAWCS